VAVRTRDVLYGKTLEVGEDKVEKLQKHFQDKGTPSSKVAKRVLKGPQRH
jgi:hypothetical protein